MEFECRKRLYIRVVVFEASLRRRYLDELTVLSKVAEFGENHPEGMRETVSKYLQINKLMFLSCTENALKYQMFMSESYSQNFEFFIILSNFKMLKDVSCRFHNHLQKHLQKYNASNMKH